MECERLAANYTQRAEKAYRAYQETGISSYAANQRYYEKIAEAAGMAADVADIKTELVGIRCDLANLGYQLRMLLDQCPPDPLFKSWAKSFLAVCSVYHILEVTRNDP